MDISLECQNDTSLECQKDTSLECQKDKFRMSNLETKHFTSLKLYVSCYSLHSCKVTI